MARRLEALRQAQFWFGTFERNVRREADLFIRSHGPLAQRYARDHVRLAERRGRAREATLYAAVAAEIAVRYASVRRAACTAGALVLSEWLPALNGVFAIAI